MALPLIFLACGPGQMVSRGGHWRITFGQSAPNAHWAIAWHRPAPPLRMNLNIGDYTGATEAQVVALARQRCDTEREASAQRFRMDFAN